MRTYTDLPPGSTPAQKPRYIVESLQYLGGISEHGVFDTRGPRGAQHVRIVPEREPGVSNSADFYTESKSTAQTIADRLNASWEAQQEQNRQFQLEKAHNRLADLAHWQQHPPMRKARLSEIVGNQLELDGVEND